MEKNNMFFIFTKFLICFIIFKVIYINFVFRSFKNIYNLK